MKAEMAAFFCYRMRNQNENKPVTGEQRQMNYKEAGLVPSDIENLCSPVTRAKNHSLFI